MVGEYKIHEQNSSPDISTLPFEDDSSSWDFTPKFATNQGKWNNSFEIEYSLNTPAN